MKIRWIFFLAVTLGILGGTQGCVYSRGGAVPTQAVDATQALQTVQAMFTLTPAPEMASTAAPSSTVDDPTPQPGTTTKPPPTRTPPGSPTDTPVCERAAAGSPIDVTIPDDSTLEPGQAFTKIWKLQNAGSCTWSEEYAAVFLYGEAMGASEVVSLASKVAPGQSIEVAVEMVAPAMPGDYQGNWKLRSPDGELFGIGPVGESPFWVRIVVADLQNGSATATSLPTFTPTPSETPPPTLIPSPTPQVAIQSQLTLEIDVLLDLDLAQPNPAQGADVAYRTGSITYHWLIPQGDAVLGVFGSQQPGLVDCQAATMSAASIPVESLSPLLYLCYRTSQGQMGWLRLMDFNPQTFSLSLDLLTWATP